VKIPKGKFVCIIGKVGSGKSSLLSAMLGEMLPITTKMIDHFKGDKDMEKELNQEETEALYDELLNHYGKVGHS
jgi:ABC-type cobalamin/Fe3+-siderophores transport system ATPase subunit